MSNAEQVRELLTGALALLDEPRTRNGDPRSAKVNIGAIIPEGVELYASQARGDFNRRTQQRDPGMWYYYLVMPSGWKPPEEESRRWMQNQQGPKAGRYWDSSTGQPWVKGEGQKLNTKDSALRAGAIRLLGVL